MKTGMTYLFVPFYMTDTELNLQGWEKIEWKTRYFLNYVTNSLYHNSTVYRLREKTRKDWNLSPMNQILKHHRSTENLEEIDFFFTLEEINLISFKTHVGLLVFQLMDQNPNTDLEQAAAFCYEQKKIQKFKGQFLQQPASPDPISLYSLSEYLLIQTGIITETEENILFNKHLYHCFFFTYAYCEGTPDTNWKKELFALKHGYHENFAYIEDSDQTIQNEVFHPMDYIYWSMSSEGIACISYDLNQETTQNFLDGSFFKNLKEQYMPLIVFLLHQKYALYYYLIQFGSGGIEEEDTLRLEQYGEAIADFKARYEFQVISETMQYQNLYDMLRHSFQLDQLFQDLEDKINQVSVCLERRQDKIQKEADQRTNKALNGIAFLAVFSALIDGIAWIDYVAAGIRPGGMHIIKDYGIWFSIFLILIWIFLSKDVFFGWLRNKKQTRLENKKERIRENKP